MGSFPGLVQTYYELPEIPSIVENASQPVCFGKTCEFWTSISKPQAEITALHTRPTNHEHTYVCVLVGMDRGRDQLCPGWRQSENVRTSSHRRAIAGHMVLMLVVALLLLPAAMEAAVGNEDISRPVSSGRRVTRALASLQISWYNASTGSWSGGDIDPNRGAVDSGMIGWWNAANALEVIAIALQRLPAGSDAWAAGQRDALLQVIPDMYQMQNWTGCMQSRSYDDSGWVSLAWIRAYEVTGTPSYLDRAMHFYSQVAREAWDGVCGGGLYWAGDKAGGGNRYKNAISNELFLATAMRLHANAPNASVAASCLTWAQREWEWFRASGMVIDNGSYVAGGLLTNCTCDMSEGFTYNQGVILGGLGMLFAATSEHDPKKRAELIVAAEAIAMGVVRPGSRWLSNNGVLVEPCERRRGCNADGTQFKGIFVRYLREYLDSVCPGPSHSGHGVNGSNSQGCASPNAHLYRQFLRDNAQSVWSSARSESDRISVHWTGPPPNPLDTNGAVAQTSGIDALLGSLGV